MTVETYKAKYGFMTHNDYMKLTKPQMIEVIAEFYDGFENGVQEYCMPTGDGWTWGMEIGYWYKNRISLGDIKYPQLSIRPKRDEDGKAVSKALMAKKKEHLAEYIVTLDLAYLTMNEIHGKHRYHDCLENIQKRFSSRRNHK